MPYHEYTITISDPLRDALVRTLMSEGCLGVIEKEEAVVAYFPDDANVKKIDNSLSLLQTLIERSDADHRVTFSHALIPEQDWNETWKKGFTPLDVGDRFTILPPWEEMRDGRINLVIDPGMAFGTGHHETTRSCLVLMERYFDKDRKESFLDVGTGTGVLAFAAARLGFLRIVAVDTDPLAVDAVRMNSSHNQIADLDIREGSITDLNDSYDFIAANILSGVLVRLSPALAEHLKPGGIAVLSGILEGQEGEVLAAITQAGLKLIKQYHDGKWVSLVIER